MKQERTVFIALALLCGSISAGVSQWLGASLVGQLVVFAVAFLATLVFGPTVIGWGDE